MTIIVTITGPSHDEQKGGNIWTVEVLDVEFGKFKSFQTQPAAGDPYEGFEEAVGAIPIICKEMFKDKLCQSQT